MCSGTNAMPVFRCPWKLITREHREAVVAVTMIEHGILPAAGAWLDQSATFVEAYPLLLRELSHWRDVESKRKSSK